jgi:hypothetical protein
LSWGIVKDVTDLDVASVFIEGLVVYLRIIVDKPPQLVLYFFTSFDSAILESFDRLSVYVFF